MNTALAVFNVLGFGAACATLGIAWLNMKYWWLVPPHAQHRPFWYGVVFGMSLAAGFLGAGLVVDRRAALDMEDRVQVLNQGLAQ